ncbi:MAG: hypothetical protein V3V67_03260 [Myxococcota bacterium]
MAGSQPQDKRLLQRSLRKGDASQAEVDKQIAELPDLGERVEQRSEEELQRVRAELEVEAAARTERVERFQSEGPRPVLRPEPVPIDEADL